jgi:GR25 family glycosyltransferase involved in LPS biosynthesis
MDTPRDVKMYCINLKHRRDRWNRFQVQPGFLDLKTKYPFEKFNAILGNDLDVEGDSRVSNRTKRNIRDSMRRDHEDLSTKGGVGCYLSHYAIWKQFVEKDSEKYCLVFEDDAIVPAQFPEAFDEYFKEFKLKDKNHIWFLYNPTNFYTFPKTGNSSSITGETGEWINDACSTTACYLISKPTARILIDNAFPVEMHVDLYMCLLRDMEKLNTVYNRNIYVSVFNVGITDTDIHVTQDCKICNVPNNFSDKGYMMVNLPQLYFAAAAVVGLWLIMRKSG